MKVRVEDQYSMLSKTSRMLSIFIFSLFLFSSTSALGYESTAVNFGYDNVESKFGYDTANLIYCKGTGDGSYNETYLSTYNSTYDGTTRNVNANQSAWLSIYNASYLSTYNASYVPYKGATGPVYLGNQVLNFNNGSISWDESKGMQRMWYMNHSGGDGFSFEYQYDFEDVNDDWIVFKKTDGNDPVPDGGIAFVMSNASGYNRSVIKIDGGLVNISNNLWLASNFTVGQWILSSLLPSPTLSLSLGSATNRWLKGWFGSLDVSGDVNISGNIIVSGNMSIKRPYGMFSSTQDQVIAAPNTPYPVTFNWTEDSWEITKSGDNANFTMMVSGDYLIELSVIVITDTNNRHVEIWPQINDVNVPRGNTKLEIENSGTEQVIAVPFILDLNAGDRFRIMWASDDAGTLMQYSTNSSYSPETPSIIMTVSKISEITD